MFAESSLLLALLAERFFGPKEKSGKGKGTWNTQVNVGSTPSAWMKTFWEQDFETQPSLMEQLEVFLEPVERDFAHGGRVQLLLSKMRGIFDIQCAKFSEAASRRQVKHKSVAKTMGKPANFAITDVKAVRLAEQLTLGKVVTEQGVHPVRGASDGGGGAGHGRGAGLHGHSADDGESEARAQPQGRRKGPKVHVGNDDENCGRRGVCLFLSFVYYSSTSFCTPRQIRNEG